MLYFVPTDNIDGGWSGWKNNVTDENGCWFADRECNSPAPCGAGLPCEGDPTSQSHTDGGWGPWQNTTWEGEEGCVSGTRECDSPPQCGTGQPCQGDSTWKSVECTPGITRKIDTLIENQDQQRFCTLIIV